MRVSTTFESMAFAWMDRKGFNYGAEELSAETLARIADRGGRYWIVEQRELTRLATPERAGFRRINQCRAHPEWSVWDLRPPEGGPPSR